MSTDCSACTTCHRCERDYCRDLEPGPGDRLNLCPDCWTDWENDR